MIKDNRVGFVGLGNMGARMARRLVDQGFHVNVCDLNKLAVAELEKSGAHGLPSPKDVAKASPTTVVMVANEPQVEEVVTGRAGLMGGASPGSTIIISSTVSPTLCRRLAASACLAGINVMDAAVSGGITGAESGTLTFMVGGDKAAFDRSRHIFEAMGKNIFHLGDVGAGEVTKLVNNILGLVNIFTATEALRVGIKAGVKTEVLMNVLKTSSGNSWVLEHWDLLTASRKQGGANKELVYKDLRLAMELAKEFGVETPFTSLAMQIDFSRLPEE